MSNFLKNMVGYFTSLEDALNSNARIKMTMCKRGVIDIRQNKIGLFKAPAKEVLGLEDISTGFELGLPKKIPMELFLHIYSFFKHYSDEYGSEAMLEVWWDDVTKNYFLRCPKQTVSPTFIHHDKDKNMVLDNRYTLVLDIHSHNTMFADFSNIDDKNETEMKLYAVMGRFDRKVPDIKLRMGMGGYFETIDMDVIFEDTINCYEGNIPTITFPQEWMDNVRVDTCRKTTTYSYTQPSNFNRGYQGNNMFDFDFDFDFGSNDYLPSDKNRNHNKNQNNSKKHSGKDKETIKPLSYVIGKVLALNNEDFNILFYHITKSSLEKVKRYFTEVGLCIIKREGVNRYNDKEIPSKEVRKLINSISSYDYYKFRDLMRYIIKGGRQEDVVEALEYSNYKIQQISNYN